MTISMYQASIPVFLRALDNLAAIMDVGAAHAEAKKIDPLVLTGMAARLQRAFANFRETFPLFAAAVVGLHAQPSFTAPPPSTLPVEDPALRRDQYLARRMEALRWRADLDRKSVV